jgi:hypothetical protein
MSPFFVSKVRLALKKVALMAKFQPIWSPCPAQIVPCHDKIFIFLRNSMDGRNHVLMTITTNPFWTVFVLSKFHQI